MSGQSDESRPAGIWSATRVAGQRRGLGLGGPGGPGAGSVLTVCQARQRGYRAQRAAGAISSCGLGGLAGLHLQGGRSARHLAAGCRGAARAAAGMAESSPGTVLTSMTCLCSMVSGSRCARSRGLRLAAAARLGVAGRRDPACGQAKPRGISSLSGGLRRRGRRSRGRQGGGGLENRAGFRTTWHDPVIRPWKYERDVATPSPFDDIWWRSVGIAHPDDQADSAVIPFRH
jgi:hypothetical protein